MTGKCERQGPLEYGENEGFSFNIEMCLLGRRLAVLNVTLDQLNVYKLSI